MRGKDEIAISINEITMKSNETAIKNNKAITITIKDMQFRNGTVAAENNQI